ncbi:hypothetical protein DM02DRAFT_648278 [Periconia macrospinosa]|uniref:Uncharacterized protein n=1 Tax=Periconia macrospinosa TaxID=97972 RepID=A0A2V1EFG6_9PLEO|nr:hypothetical protein DM02DRAFT_648278 [Periconia macrospinosa]
MFESWRIKKEYEELIQSEITKLKNTEGFMCNNAIIKQDVERLRNEVEDIRKLREKEREFVRTELSNLKNTNASPFDTATVKQNVRRVKNEAEDCKRLRSEDQERIIVLENTVAKNIADRSGSNPAIPKQDVERLKEERRQQKACSGTSRTDRRLPGYDFHRNRENF